MATATGRQQFCHLDEVAGSRVQDLADDHGALHGAHQVVIPAAKIALPHVLSLY